jgi:hypothetical protein
MNDKIEEGEAREKNTHTHTHHTPHTTHHTPHTHTTHHTPHTTHHTPHTTSHATHTHTRLVTDIVPVHSYSKRTHVRTYTSAIFFILQKREGSLVR